MQKLFFGISIIVALLVVGCENGNGILNPAGKGNLKSLNSINDLSKSSDLYLSSPGAVYAMTNSSDGNEIVAFTRSINGTLKYLDRYDTKGVGSGGEIDPLGSQGSLILSNPSSIASAKRWLFAVNAGSNQISTFGVQESGLELYDLVGSGGEFPVSLTEHGNLLYVLNAKGAAVIKNRKAYSGGNITGFRIGSDGRLRIIPKSTRPLSIREEVNPAQIQFSPDGKFLIVTEKTTNIIDVYQVKEDGLAEGPITYHSIGETPFGFVFDQKDRMIITEAADGVPNASSASLYELGYHGGIHITSSSVPTYQTDGCWIAVTNDGRLGFISNTISNTITALEIIDDQITIVQDDGIAAKTGDKSFPIDLALSQDNRFLYVLNAGLGTIGTYEVQQNGDLRPIETSSKLSEYLPANAGVQGLAAY